MNRRQTFAAVAAPFLLTQKARADVVVPGLDCTLEIAPALSERLGPLIDKWIGKSAEAVITYYGKFPVPRLHLRIGAEDSKGVKGGRSEPGDPPDISVGVGVQSDADDLLKKDWVLVHEMIHMAIPYVPRNQYWVAEGLAVYVESVARVQAGHIMERNVWREFAARMPRGLPADGDKGLNYTRAHGRIYWGGAVFFLLADIRLREATQNRLGLQQALRAINARMDFRQEATAAEIFAAGDGATGTAVLAQLYREWAMNPGTVDLGATMKALGVTGEGESLVFDDTAPQAGFRKSIMMRQDA